MFNSSNFEDIEQFEVREDLLTRRTSILVTARKKRQIEIKNIMKSFDFQDSQFDIDKEIKKPEEFCPFCPGYENPEEIERYRFPEDKTKPWIIRSVDNKFPSVRIPKNESEEKQVKIEDPFYFRKYPYGQHEIIVETNKHDQKPAQFSLQKVTRIVQTYINRYNELMKPEKIQYVVLFKNHGLNSGASKNHPHSQIMSLDFVPSDLKQKVEIFKNNPDILLEIIKKERDSPRFCYENDTFIVITPYASFYNYHLSIIPKTKKLSISELNQKEQEDLADILRKAWKCLAIMDAPWNLVFSNAPKNVENFHFMIEILPRTTFFAGFELLTGDGICTVSPEKAAAFYQQNFKWFGRQRTIITNQENKENKD
ncbi:adp-glucose phosphorylase [Anaeramoeba ignava]|uniref:Adp-glucose phosphorylase n=1 Tax=Anaeramoeba ignava TaxID=1746090 RepID=A0A9Q0LM56_ANAIG|nr:adp-glucose phosphorylase [Anaeramoeba ignava]